jgi:gliding motility-associated-like protein
MKRILSLLAVIFFTFTASQTKASHFAAMDIWYEYMSPLTYKVHIACYLDCSPNSANYFVSNFCYWTTSGNAVGGSSTILTSDTTGTNDPFQNDTLDQLCAGVPNYCASSASVYPAFHYRHFIKIVTLPSAEPDWNFGVSDGARNSTIANGFANQNISVAAELNNVTRPINSSPYLSVKPIPYVCFNTPQVYQNGPQDPDLDSVVFEANTPRGGSCTAQTNLTFSGTNSLLSPFPSTNFLVNPTTGSASFTATTQGIYVMGFKATDYDKNTGVKVGSSMRDVQIVVLACASPPPIADSVGFVTGAIDSVVNGQHVMTVCPGTTMSFQVFGYTQSTSNNLLSYGNNSQLSTNSPAFYTTNPPNGGSDSVTGTFSWTPTQLDYGNHALILSFVDSTCAVGQPIVLKSYITITIKVLPGVSAGGPYNYCPGGAPLQLTAFGPPGITSWTWSTIPGQAGNPQANISNLNIANPTATPNVTVDVMVEGLPIVTGCPNKDTVTLNVFSPLLISAGPDLTPCANDAIQIVASSNRPPVNTLGFSNPQLWSPKTFMTGGQYSLTPSLTPLGNAQYILSVVDLYGCKAYDTVNVIVQGIRPIINAYAAKDPVCIGEALKLYANASPQPCGITANAGTGPSTNKTVGSGNTANSFFSPFFRDASDAYRAQYLIRASELVAAGMSPGNIKGLTLTVQNSPSNPLSDSLLGFNVKLGCSPLLELSTNSGFVSGLSTVFSASKFSPTLGNNVINFPITSEYFWDGKSSIVVEFCYNLPTFSGGSPATVASNITAFNSSLVEQELFGSPGCSLTGSGFGAATSSLRPNFKFMFSKTNTFSYLWTPSNSFNNDTLENPTVKPGVIQNNTSFSVTVISGATGQCNGTATVNVTIDNSGSVDPTATPNHLCQPGLTTLNAVPGFGTQPPVFDCGEENYIANAPSGNFTIGAGAFNNNVPFNWYQGGKTQYLILASELTAAGISKGYIDQLAINVLTKNTSTPYTDFNIHLSCTKDNSLTSLINTTNNKQVYNSPSYNTSIGWNNFVFNKSNFLWDGVSNLVVDMCYAFYNGNWPGDYVATSNQAFSACYSSGTFNGDGCSIPLTVSGNQNNGGQETYRPITRLNVTPVADKQFQYVWNPPLYVYDTAKAQTLAYVLNSKTYTVSLVNKTGCLISDTVKVNIETHDVTVSPVEVKKCELDLVQITAFGTGTGKFPTYQWLPNLDYTLEADTTIITKSKVPITYMVIRTDEFGCKDSATSQINTLPDPIVTILNGDTLLVPYGNEVNLIATGAYLYTWTPSWGLSNSNSNNTFISPKEDGLYYVFGIDTNGCSNYDTIYIKMNNVNPVFIPTAFSPNGDGYNDKFRVQNFKFEKVQEFLVFNRLGEEIFSGKDNSGWDGTYRGKKSDMDTYMYLIRLAYPDGSVKVFKGDVLLMK